MSKSKSTAGLSTLRSAVLLTTLALTGCLSTGGRTHSPPSAGTELPATGPGQEADPTPAASPEPSVVIPATQPDCGLTKPTITSPAETHADYSKGMINAHIAYELGLTGHCVEVAVIDSGLSSIAHSELPRERIRLVQDPDWALIGFPITYSDAEEPTPVGNNEVLSFAVASHGTEVSSVIAAASDDYGMHGVAPGSIVNHLTLSFGGGGGGGGSPPPRLTSLDGLDGWFLTRRFGIAMQYGSILNMSWSWIRAPSHPAPHPDAPFGQKSHYTEEELRAAFSPSIDEVIDTLFSLVGVKYSPEDFGDETVDLIKLAAQADVDEDDRKIFVWAAANNGEEGFPYNPRSPALPAGLSGRIPELQGHWLSVVAVGQSGEIESFSNLCGVAQDYCLAAPGTCILAATAYAVPPMHAPPVNSREYRDGSCVFYDPDRHNYVRTAGTSFSAPIVSGALALMIERFRGQLGNTAVVRRMLDTANKTGIYADSDIYGQGLLDVGAAVLPVGSQQISLQGHAIPLPHLNTSFSDSFRFIALLQSGISGQEIMVRDELGGPFWLSFNELPGASKLPLNQAWTAPATLISRNRGGWGIEYLGSGGFSSKVPGYALDTRSDGAWGVFAATGLSPAALTGLRLSSLQPEDFGRDTAFTAPWLDLLAHDSIGAGLELQTSFGSWALAGFTGHSSTRAFGNAENRLTLLEYRHSSGKLDLLLQRGSIEEPDSWAGAWTENSIYGHFAGRMQFAGLTTAWHLTPDWQLLGAMQWMRMHLKPLSQGLLLELKELQDSRLELGALGRSVLHKGDSLGLRWQAVQQSSERAWWRLPQKLYRRQIQYGDLALELQSPVYQSLELSWQLPLQSSSSLMLGVGRNGLDSLLQSTDASDYATLRFHLSF